MSRELWKNMCLRKCKLCRSNVKKHVFEGFANWMQDDGNQQKYFKNMKTLPQLMTNPCRIDARKSNAKNMENDANMAPKWRSKSIKQKWKTIQKHITKNDLDKRAYADRYPLRTYSPACEVLTVVKFLDVPCRPHRHSQCAWIRSKEAGGLCSRSYRVPYGSGHGEDAKETAQVFIRCNYLFCCTVLLPSCQGSFNICYILLSLANIPSVILYATEVLTDIPIQT
jgi:hypothetical protein